MIRRFAGLRKFGRYCFMAFLFLLLFISAFLWYTTTASFQQMVRGRLTAAIQRATGGRVELGSFHVVPLRFEVEVRNLTIHGRETSGVPYIHVDSMLATVNLSSAFGAKVGFHSLTLQHPVAHLIVYPDGSTNQPIPVQQGKVDFARLFSISIDRLEVRNGEVIWQDQTIPLDFQAEDVSAGLNYSFFHRRYSGSVGVKKAETQFNGYRPLAWGGRSDFSVGESGIEINSLQATAESSQIQANGLIANFRNPVFKGKYKVLLDVRQAGAIIRQPELKAGKLGIDGEGSWSAQSFAAGGIFDLREFAAESKAISLKGAAAAGRFSLDPQKFSLSQVAGRALNGSFAADAEVTGWRSTAAPHTRGDERGVVKVRAKDISVAELLGSLGAPFRPINRLKLAGDLTGTSDVKWAQSARDAEISFAVEVARPGKLAAGQIPLTAIARGTYEVRTAELNLVDFNASTPATQIRASGAMTAASAMRILFTTSDLGEWQPVIANIFPSGAPFAVHGRAIFNGTARAAFQNPVIAGNLQVQDFDSLLAETPHTKAQRHHWDSLVADLQISGRSLNVRNALLSRGDETVRVDGSAELAAWNLPPEGGFRLEADVHNSDVSELARLANLDHALEGRLDARVHLVGTRLHPQGNGTLSLKQGSIDGQKFDSASATVGIDGAQTTFRGLTISRGPAIIHADGTYDLSSHAFDIAATGNDFDLAQFSQLERSRIKLAGKLDFTAHAAGVPSAPTVTANLHVRDVSMNDEMVGDLVLDVQSHGQDLRLNGKSNFASSELFVDGDVQLREQWPSRIDFRFSHLDIDSFLESYLHGHATGHSAVAGSVQVRGPLRNPGQMTVVGNLTELRAELDKIKLHNEGPIHFEIADRNLRLERVHITGDNTDFSGGGSVQLAGEKAINLQGHGQADLKLIESYDRDFSASGTLTGEAAITGSLDSPVAKGKLRIENAAISDINMPSALSEINGSFNFSQNQVTIENLTAKTGGGTVAFTGHAEVAGKQLNFDLTASANAVRLRYPPGVSSTANAELHWSGSSAGSTLAGDVTIIKLGATPGFDFGAYLQRAAQVSSLPQTDPVLNKIRLDLHLVTAPELQMQTSIIRLQGDADLRIRGNAAKPVILGRADILEGEASFNGTKYRLERGGVSFNNPAVTTPFLDLEATTRVRDYEVTLSMSGELDKPKINYRSEPPLPTADIIALLAFGQTTEQSAQLQQSSQSAFSQQASNAMLAAALNATLSNRTQRLFGVSRIKIDPQGLATETSPTQNGPAVTIEQQVKDNLTVTYTTSVAQASQQVIRAEYNVSKNVSVVAIRDQNGVVSFDVKIRRRKR
jgi:translocation and assembly module TamB